MNKKRYLYYLKAFGYNFLEECEKNNQNINQFISLKKKIIDCKLCHFSKNRQKNVLDDYKKNAKLMIISDHISESENKSGILLNSKNGEKLKSYINNILNINLDEIYITYIYKCFSKFNDDFCLNSCLPYLFNEINIINPKIIFLLGKNSFENIGLRNFEILKGEFLKFKNINTISSYDINYIEKNPSLEKDFINTLYKIKGKI